MASSTSWDPSHLRKYSITTEPLQRLPHTDPRVDKLISKGQPVVITGTNLIAAASHWNLDYLEDNIGDANFSVYESSSHKFKYFDEKKCSAYPNFPTPMNRVDLKFPEFVDRIENWKAGEKRLYLQQTLNESVGRNIVLDFLKFKWDWVMSQQKRNHWGPLTSNLLLIAQPGNVTPCHYDEQENLFAQLAGYKRVILFAPGQFENLYPYPVQHPHDRQSQVDFENPDHEKFPKFKDLQGLEAVLGPGDVLYLPMYWWHHFESLMDGQLTISITFWYKSSPVGKVEYPLKDHQKVAMMRNIEKMINEALNNPEEVAPFFRNLVLGRFTHDPD